MSYQLEVDYSPAYELIVSVYCYMYHTSLRGNYLSSTWVKEVSKQLTPSFKEVLADKRYEVMHRLAILVWQCPNKETVDGFLSWLEALSTGEIYEKMIPWVHEFKEDMRVVKDRMIQILRDWNEQYFQNMDQTIHTNLLESAKQERAVAGKEPAVEQVERVTSGIFLMNTDKHSQVILIPQYHCAPRTILDFYEEGLIVCQYPYVVGPPQNEQEERLLRIMQCLSDEHRLRIYEFLSKEPRTYSEIQKYTGLGKGLVHYHIMQLRLAGLIHAHYRDGKLKDYGLRREHIVSFTKDLLTYIHMNGE